VQEAPDKKGRTVYSKVEDHDSIWRYFYVFDFKAVHIWFESMIITSVSIHLHLRT